MGPPLARTRSRCRRRSPRHRRMVRTLRTLVLEIGSGTGTAAVSMAQAEPHVDLIAVEVYLPGIAQTLQRIERTAGTDAPVSNLRILRGDAVEVLEHMVAPESLTGVRVFFPDPWPKARHHKRRLLQPTTFALIASRLKPGGVLHVATDHAEYAEWILEAGNAEPQLTDVTWESPISTNGRSRSSKTRLTRWAAASPRWSGGRSEHERP